MIRYLPNQLIVPSAPDLPEYGATPEVPGAGYQRVYAFTDGLMRHEDATGLTRLMTLGYPGFPPTSGDYTRGFALSDTPSPAGAASVVDTLYAMPLIIPWGLSIQAVSLTVMTLSVGGNVRLGIYAHNHGTGSPGALVVDAGTISTTTTGIKDAATSTILPPGLYWFAFVSDAMGAAALLEVTTATQSMGLSIAAGGATTAVRRYGSRAFVYAALPDPWGAVGVWATTAPYRMTLKMA